jgi:hypothetical protein
MSRTIDKLEAQLANARTINDQDLARIERLMRERDRYRAALEKLRCVSSENNWVGKLIDEALSSQDSEAARKPDASEHKPQGYCAPCDGTCVVQPGPLANHKQNSQLSSDSCGPTHTIDRDTNRCACGKFAFNSDDAISKATVLKGDNYYWTPEAWATFQRYREALEWYSDSDQYREHYERGREWRPPILKDRGIRATKALSSKGAINEKP